MSTASADSAASHVLLCALLKQLIFNLGNDTGIPQSLRVNQPESWSRCPAIGCRDLQPISDLLEGAKLPRLEAELGPSLPGRQFWLCVSPIRPAAALLRTVLSSRSDVGQRLMHTDKDRAALA